MLTSANLPITSMGITPSLASNREFLRQHLKDHERGEFTQKPISLEPTNATSLLQEQYIRLVKENLQLQKECTRLEMQYNIEQSGRGNV